jgi:hypothetical protein
MCCPQVGIGTSVGEDPVHKMSLGVTTSTSSRWSARRIRTVHEEVYGTQGQND